MSSFFQKWCLLRSCQNVFCSSVKYTVYTPAVIVQVSLKWVLSVLFFLAIILITPCTSRERRTFGFSQIEGRIKSEDQIRVVAVSKETDDLWRLKPIETVYSASPITSVNQSHKTTSSRHESLHYSITAQSLGFYHWLVFLTVN